MFSRKIYHKISKPKMCVPLFSQVLMFPGSKKADYPPQTLPVSLASILVTDLPFLLLKCFKTHYSSFALQPADLVRKLIAICWSWDA